MKKVKIYGTIGPSCADPEIIYKMFKEGMDGIRLNLSHAALEESAEAIEAFHEAAEMYMQELCDTFNNRNIDNADNVNTDNVNTDNVNTDNASTDNVNTDNASTDNFNTGNICTDNATADNDEHERWKPKLLIDMQGPELRIGKLDEPIKLSTGDLISIEAIPFSKEVLNELYSSHQICSECGGSCQSEEKAAGVKGQSGQEILLDDGKILLKTEKCQETNFNEEADLSLRVIRGGVLESRKSVTLPGCEIDSPAMTELDKYNISMAKEYGVTGVMQPFVRSREDLIEVRRALDQAGCEDVRLLGKIENKEGIEKAKEIIQYCDEIVIARGDLGNSMQLWQLPAVQKRLSAACREAGRDFLVVTQMLDSMNKRQVPTRAEVSDIFNAVLDGASSVMLTGETATGDYPVDSIIYMARTVREAEKFSD